MNFSKLVALPNLFLLIACTATQPQNQNTFSNQSAQFSQPKTQTSQISSNRVVSTTPKSSQLIVGHACENVNFEALLIKQSASSIEGEYDLCLQNANSRYGFAQALFQHGYIEESLEQLQLIPNTQNKSSKLTMLETSDLVKRMDSPFVYAAERANEKLEQWLTRESEVPAFDLKPPVRKNPPTPPIVIRSEFETTQEFNVRKRGVEKEYLQKINDLELEYQQAVEDYNNNIEKYNASLEWEIRSRQERAEMMRNEFLINEINVALGKLLIDNLNYNADEQIYYADLISTESNYGTRIAIEIPLEVAPSFKQDYAAIFVIPNFKIAGGVVNIQSIDVPYNGTVYRATLTSKDYGFSPAREVITLKTLQDLKVDTMIPDEKILRNQMNINQVINDNRRFFQNAVN